jgi:hypothetical protein
VSAETNQKRKKKCERRISSSTSCSKLQGNNTPAVSYIYIHRHENILTCTTRVEEREKNCVICLERVTATPGETHTHTHAIVSLEREKWRDCRLLFLSFFLLKVNSSLVQAKIPSAEHRGEKLRDLSKRSRRIKQRSHRALSQHVKTFTIDLLFFVLFLNLVENLALFYF